MEMKNFEAKYEAEAGSTSQNNFCEDVGSASGTVEESISLVNNYNRSYTVRLKVLKSEVYLEILRFFTIFFYVGTEHESNPQILNAPLM